MPISTATEDPADRGVSFFGKTELVIFDLDGTLVDTIADLAYAVNETLISHGWPSRNIQEIKSMVGDGFPPLVRRAVPPEVLEQDSLLSQVLAEASDLYTIHCVDNTRPYPEVKKLLEELSKRSLPCAVLSNKAHAFSTHIVSRLFPEGSFVVVQGEITGIPKKPHPQAALSLASRVGYSPSGCVLVGDSPHDMMAARSAGMRAFGAGWGYRSAAELLTAGAERVFSRPLELLDFI
jgi:phosphoglycolate phosphatase